MSPAVIRRMILRALTLNAPHPTPFEGLLAHVNEVLRPKLQAAELTQHLRHMLDAGWIDFIADDFDAANEDARRWLIKEAGEAALRR